MMCKSVQKLLASERIRENDLLRLIRFLNFLTYGEDQPAHIKRLGLEEGAE